MTHKHNVSALARLAAVSRRQVLRDLEAGAPADADNYLAWRRARHAADRETIDYALARGADVWSVYAHQQRRYTDRAGVSELTDELMRRLTAAVAGVPELAELLSHVDHERAYPIVAGHISDAVYASIQRAFFTLTVHEADPPDLLCRPADGSLAGVRAWIRQGQTASMELRTERRDGLVLPVEDLEFEARDAGAQARLHILGVAGGVAAMAGRTPTQIRGRIEELTGDALLRSEKALAHLERKKR